jgi:hypothetical protein
MAEMNVVCSACGREGPRHRPDSLVCRDCCNERQRAYRAMNAEKYRQYSRAYYSKNAEILRQRSRAYALRNQDKVRENSKKANAKNYELNRDRAIAKAKAWHAANPEKAREAKRRWREKNRSYWRQLRQRFPEKVRARGTRRNRLRRSGRDRTSYAYGEILRNDPCSYCGGVAGQVDHIQAVTEGGSNEWTNLTASCRSCNGQKWTKPLLMFLLESRVLQ